MKTLLTIAGFDPSSGAGVTADLTVFAAHGFFGTSCITSLTVQSTRGVRGVSPVAADLISETLDCLQEDLPAAGIKIGMLGTKSAVIAAADFLARLRESGSEIPVVVDPVLRASSGGRLLEAGATNVLMNRLLPLADWVTPNLDELGWLTGKLVNDTGEMERVGRLLQDQVGGAGRRQIQVLVKGGHLEVPRGEPNAGEPAAPDDLLLTFDGGRDWLRGQRVKTTSTHGTGCALSSALLCRLVMGDAPLGAATHAKAYVAEALRRAVPIGGGRGPVAHLWPLRGVSRQP